jgi:hypothetical protein
MDTLLDGAFGALFDTVDPLGMILRTLLALLADSLSTVITSLYSGLFEITTIDLSTAAVRNIWAITTGISASLATILLVIASFRSMVAQSNRYLLEALPGVVLAILGPQFITAFLPWLAAASTALAQAIVASATPDLAASMRLLAGVGSNPFYEGLGLMAPVVAAMLLFGMSMVFFVLLFCMATAVVLYVLSPFAFAGLVMAPTRAWFTKWSTGMFAVVFAKVPIAILLALSVSLFANSAHNGTVQSFVNAGAGLILGLGALLSPLLAFGLFSFMGAVATRPAAPSFKPAQALGSAYYGTQMGRAGINGAKSVASRLHGAAGRTGTPPDPTPGSGPGGPPAPRPAPAGPATPATPSTPTTPSTSPGPVPAPIGGALGRGPSTTAGTGAPGAVSRTAAGPATAGGAAGPGGVAGTAGVAGAATAGLGTIVVAGAAAARKSGRTFKHGVSRSAAAVSTPPESPGGPAPSVRPRTAT